MSESETNNAFAMACIAVSSDRLPDADLLHKAANPRSGIGRLLGGMFGSKKLKWEDKGMLVFPAGDVQVAVALMPGPIPWSDLEGPCATSISWKNAASSMKNHQKHLLISMLGGSMEPVLRRIILTRVVSAAIQSCDPIGVYWPDGTLVHKPEDFVDMAEGCKPNSIPGPLWIDVRLTPNPDRTIQCFTTGLAPLGFREIEVHQCSSRTPKDLYLFIGDLACYIVNGRVQIKDGETVGRSAEERICVKYSPSLFNRAPVMQFIFS